MTTLPTPKRLAREYERGATLRQLGDRYGVDESTVRHHLRGHIVPRRTGPPKAPVDDARIVALVGEGWSWQDIADEVGMSRSGVRKRYTVATTGQQPWR